MNRGKHVVAIDAHGEHAAHDEILLTEEDVAERNLPEAPANEWDAEEEAPSLKGGWIAPALAGLAIAGWTGLFLWSKWPAVVAYPSLEMVIGWIGTWSGPVLVVCVAWLLAMRSSRREAARFNDAARALGLESQRLEQRLTSVNSELSLAREFISAQGRDLEALGRLATERLSQNAELLQGLIVENGAQIDAISSVSNAALENMEKLRGQLPVIATAARDVTNNIASAGRTAHGQVQDLIEAFKRINEFGQASEKQVQVLRDIADETMTALLSQSAQLEELTERRFGDIIQRGEAISLKIDADQVRAIQGLDARIAALAEQSALIANQVSEAESAATEAMASRMALIDSDIAARHDSQLEKVQAIASQNETVTGQMAELEARLDAVAALAREAQGTIDESLSGLESRLSSGRSLLGETDGEIAGLTDASVRLLEIIQAGSQHSREILPAAISEAEMRLGSVETRITAMRSLTEEAVSLGDRLVETIDKSHVDLAAVTRDIARLQGEIDRNADTQGAALATIQQAISRIASDSGDVATKLETELSAALERIVEERGAELAERIEQATARASETGRETTILLRDQLSRVDELAGNLERRVAHARERAEEKVENDFARRVALITESLNSHAIDISRALDTDVSDIAWSAYLKGDRGIFTRRAVALLQAGESKLVVQAYENDPDLQAHVNRYIHDFEAMLRQVLSTRDGDALGVTLLSSDMGKLYVALAQAIERLRR